MKADAGARSSAGSAPESADENSGTKENLPTILSEDPADYFQRISPDRRLFEIIEERYRIETREWPEQGLL